MMTLSHSSAFLRASVLPLFFITVAHADELTTSWRLQGPAFSHHFSNEIAPIRNSKIANDGLNIPPRAYQDFNHIQGENTLDYCTRWAATIVGRAPELIQLGRDFCLRDLQEPYRHGGKQRWNEKNLELGIEYDIRNRTTKTVQRYYFGAVVDSYFKPGVYLGGSYQATVYDTSRFQVDAGMLGMLWWRTIAGEREPPRQPTRTTKIPAVAVAVEDTSQWTLGLRRRLVPAVLPVVSIEDKVSGIGANISFVPKIQNKGKIYSVSTLMVQMTWAL